MMGDRTERSVTIRCVECDDFEFTKSFSGMPGTRGYVEYHNAGVFDSCPACGGDLEQRGQER